jgi:hypothetical protein
MKRCGMTSIAVWWERQRGRSDWRRVEVVLVGAQLERVATFAAGEQLDMRIVQHPSAEADLDAVRLLTRSPIYALCQYPIADAHHPYVEAVTMGGVRLPSLRARTPEVIEPIGAAFVETWQRLRALDGALSGKEKARFDRAIRRFRDAYGRAASEDRLIDSWIGLKALVLSDSKQELAYKAGIRIAALVGHTGGEREHLFKSTKKLYAARSAVAHEPRTAISKLRPTKHTISCDVSSSPGRRPGRREIPPRWISPS